MTSSPILFTGIKNDFGTETKFRIYLDLTKTSSYTTDFYIENKRSDAKIDPEKGQLTLGENVYDYYFKTEGDEILLVATEELDTLDNMFNYLFCRSKPNFMLGTNKMEV
jgi:hypothetical protein